MDGTACLARILFLLAIGLSLRSTLSEAVLRGHPAASESSSPSTPLADQLSENGSQTHGAAPDADGIYEMGNGVPSPKVISSVSPEYTDLARKKKLSGTCVVEVVVDTSGNPQNIRVASSLAEGLGRKLKKAAESLDQSAMKAASQYRFAPVQYQGKTVPVRVKIEVQFQIY